MSDTHDDLRLETLLSMDDAELTQHLADYAEMLHTVIELRKAQRNTQTYTSDKTASSATGVSDAPQTTTKHWKHYDPEIEAPRWLY